MKCRMVSTQYYASCVSCTTDGRDARSDAADACIVDAAVVAGAVNAGVGSGRGKG